MKTQITTGDKVQVIFQKKQVEAKVLFVDMENSRVTLLHEKSNSQFPKYFDEILK